MARITATPVVIDTRWGPDEYLHSKALASMRSWSSTAVIKTAGEGGYTFIATLESA
jgi:hypothetical protein